MSGPDESALVYRFRGLIGDNRADALFQACHRSKRALAMNQSRLITDVNGVYRYLVIEVRKVHVKEQSGLQRLEGDRLLGYQRSATLRTIPDSSSRGTSPPPPRSIPRNGRSQNDARAFPDL